MTVKKQLLLMLISFSVLPVMILTTVHLSTSISTIENLHINRLNAITHTAAAAFKEIVGLQIEDVSKMSSGDVFKDYLKLLESNSVNSGEAKSVLTNFSGYLKSRIDLFASFDDAVFLDSNGVVIAACDDSNLGKNLSGMDYFVRAKDPRYIGKVFNSKVHKSLRYPDDPKKNCIALGQAFYSEDGTFLGTLVAFVNAYIMAEFSHSISFGQTGLSFVIDSDNYILFHPEERFYDSYTASPQLSDLFSRWMANEIPASGIINGFMDGKRRIYYYEVMSDIELILILRQDYDEFSAGRTSTIVSAVISGTITLFTAIFMGIQFSNRFMKPIMLLKNSFSSADKLGSYIICELPLNNELGDMAKSYNSMIMKLEKQYDLLKLEKEKNEYIAKYDKLTGLFNRSSLEHLLSDKLNSETSFGVFFVDLDNLKEINDIYGHAAGDSLLRLVAQRILNSEAGFDICARIGGDEFILSKNGSSDEMKKCAEILLNELNKPYLVNDLKLYTTASIGISMYPQDAVSIDKLVANADIAMYKAKDTGKNTFAIYTDDMRSDNDLE